MKPSFTDLSQEERETFGNGCTWVPDFIFTANCRQHDFNYERGGDLRDKLKADYGMCFRMFSDAMHSNHKALYGLLSVLYYLGLTFLPVSYFLFSWGHYKTLDEIREADRRSKNGIMSS